jgi:hypothetical protein
MKISRIAISAPLLAGIAFLQASCGDSSGPGNVATAIVANSSTTLTAAPGAPVAEPPSVIVSDQNNRPLAGVHVIFAVTSGGGAITGGNVTTDVNGVATVASWTLGASEGPNTLTATAGSLPPVVFTANGADPCVPSTAHALGTTTNGELTRADCSFSDGSFVDFYAVTLSTAGTVVFNQTSSTFNTFLILYDFDANLIGINDNLSATSSDSRIKAILPAGTYVVGANSWDVNITGAYKLTSLADGGGNVTNCEVVFLVKGSASSESLQTTDCARTGSTGSYEDRYLIFLTADQAMTVSMNSSAIDSYLAIYAPGNATPLGQNDDKDATTKDAQLAFTPTATGFYFIAATSGSVGATGAYSFTIQ